MTKRDKNASSGWNDLFKAQEFDETNSPTPGQVVMGWWVPLLASKQTCTTVDRHPRLVCPYVLLGKVVLVALLAYTIWIFRNQFFIVIRPQAVLTKLRNITQ